MNAEQVNQLLNLLAKIAENISKPQPYTITGAADWPLLLVLGFVLVGLIGWMWKDLKDAMRENKAERTKAIDDIWNEMERCQHECCPRRESK